MFDAQCDLAAVVYGEEDDPDTLLRGFAADLNSRGRRAVGLVQVGHHCVDQHLSAMLVHSGEELSLFQDLGSCARGCRLDVGRLLDAGMRIAEEIDRGADLVIINRFGKQECEGKGLAYVIERALEADIPVVIAVPVKRFADWIKFSGGMSVKLNCDHTSLAGWWRLVSRRGRATIGLDHEHLSVCAALK
jgi:Protein of unknown function (DUF2478)